MRRPTRWTSARATTWCSCPASAEPDLRRLRPRCRHGRGAHQHPETQRQHRHPLSLGRAPPSSSSLPLAWRSCRCCWCAWATSPSRCPLSMVARSSPSIGRGQEVGGRATMVVRGECSHHAPVHPAGLGSGPDPQYGVLMQGAEQSFILAIDSFAGREDCGDRVPRRLPSEGRRRRQHPCPTGRSCWSRHEGAPRRLQRDPRCFPHAAGPPRAAGAGPPEGRRRSPRRAVTLC